MQPETCKVELSVEFVPVSPEREAAFRQALRILVGLIRELMESEAQSLDGGGLRSVENAGMGGDALSGSECSMEAVV